MQLKRTFSNRENKSYNTLDGEIWNSRSVAVVAVVLCVSTDITHVTHVLLEKRGKHLDFPGMWCLPCGYLDWDETLEDAVIREVFEETGVFLPEHEHEAFKNCRIHSGYVKGSEKQNVSVCSAYVLNSKDPEDLPKLTASLETPQVSWVKLERAMKQHLAFNHVAVLKEIYEKIITSYE